MRAAEVRAYDPEGMANAKSMIADVIYCRDAYECTSGADAVTIVTEWDMFRALDWDRIKRQLRSPILVDLRNIYRPDEMRKRGFSYHSVGQAELKESSQPSAAENAPSSSLDPVRTGGGDAQRHAGTDPAVVSI